MPQPPTLPIVTTLVTNPVSGTGYGVRATQLGANDYVITLQPGAVTQTVSAFVLAPACNAPTGPSYLTVNTYGDYVGGGVENTYLPTLTWNVSDNAGTLVTQNSTTVRWTAPATPGDYLLYNVYTSNGDLFASSRYKVVTVLPAPTTPVVTVPTYVSPGGQYSFSTPIVSSIGGGSYNWTITNGTINVYTGGHEGGLFTAGSSGTVTITCQVTNYAGTNSSYGYGTSTIVADPVAISFVVQSGAYITTPGAASVLVATFSGGQTVCKIGTTPGGSEITSDTASPLSYTVYPSTTTDYYMVVTNSLGRSTGVISLRITVMNKPTASIAWSPVGPSPYGTYESVIPSFSGTSITSAVIGSYQGGADWVNPATSGFSYGITSSLTSNLTAWLRVTNAVGYTDASATVTVQPVVCSPISGGGGYVTLGYTRSLSATVAGAANTNVNWTTTGGTCNPTTTQSGSATVWSAPASVGDHSITATSAADVSKHTSTTITVVYAPTASITAASTSLTSGSGTTVTPIFANGTATITPTLPGTPTLVSGTAYSTGNLSSNTNYVLTVTNLAGLSVTPAPAVYIYVYAPPLITSFAASPTSITSGSTSTLSGAFVNTNSETGSINQGIGTVTSPISRSVAPTATTATVVVTYTLTSRDVSGATTTRDATVTVYPLPVATYLNSNCPSGIIPLWTAGKLTVGQPAQLTPGFSYGTGVIALTTQPPGSTMPPITGPLVSGTAYTTGNFNTAGTYTFTLTVTNPLGVTASIPTSLAVYTAPTVQSFTAVGNVSGTSTITVGDKAKLTPIYSDGNGSVDNTIGSMTSGTNVDVSPTVTTTYLLTVTNPAGYPVTRSVTVTVVAAPIVTLSTNKTGTTNGSGITGETAILSWTSTGATTLSINGASVSPISAGTYTVTPPNILATYTSTTYTITATNAAGTQVTASKIITAYAPPSVQSFVASTQSPLHGATVNLNTGWTSPGGGTASIDNGLGSLTTVAGTNTGTKTTGILPVALTQGTDTAHPTTYTLTVTNAVGGTLGTVTATVTVTPQFVQVSTPSGATAIAINTPQTYTSTVTGAAVSSLTWQKSSGTATGTWVGNIFTPTGLGTAVIEADSVGNPGKNSSNSTIGGISQSNLSIVVVAAPTGTLVAQPNASPLRGSTGVTLLPTHNGDSAKIGTTVGGSDITASAETGIAVAVQSTGAGFVSPITYWMRVTSLAGATLDVSATVTPQTVGVVLTPATASPLAGAGVALSATVSGAVNPTVTWSASSGSVNSSGMPSGNTTLGTYTTPNGPATITITARSVSDSTKTSTSTITAPTVGITASALKTSLLVGEATTLSATVTNGSLGTYTWSIDGVDVNHGNIVGGVYTAGTATSVVLRATSLDDATKSATITMTVSSIAVSVTPLTINVATNGSTTFTATVTGAVLASQGVSWSVDGTGNGTIGSATGIYTAPASVPTGLTATIRATSSADTSKSGTAIATIVPSPVIANFTSSVSSPKVGQPYTLTGTFSNGTGVIGIIPVTSGTATSNFTATTSPVAYMLTVTNPISGSISLGLTVTPQTVVVAISPTTKSLLAGESTTFAATVTGAVDEAVTWTCSAGTILPSGQYTAPLTTVSGNTATVTATSVADPTKSATATITLAVVSVSLATTAKTLTIGSGFPETATIAGAVNISVVWSVTGYGSVTQTGLYTANTVGAGTVRATSTIDATKYAECIFTVVQNGSISSFTSALSQYGAAAVLNPVFSNGTATITPTLPGDPTITSGHDYDTAALTVDTIFTLTVTNAALDQSTFPLTVRVPAVVINGPTPSNPRLLTISNTTFIANVLYAYDATANWTATWNDGTPAGSFSPTVTGKAPDNYTVWTAPSVPTATGQYITIKVTSIANPTVFTSTQVTVAYPIYSGKKSAIVSS